MQLVATHSFFRTYGREDALQFMVSQSGRVVQCEHNIIGFHVRLVILMQIQVIDAIDQTIFRSTNWTEGLIDLGLSIRNVNFTTVHLITLCRYIMIGYLAPPPQNYKFTAPSLDIILNETLQITIHDVPTGPGEEPIYNQQPPPGGWNSNTLLSHFSHANWSQYCMSYLFTSERFSDGRLGVAYIASPASGLTGGICSESR